MLAAAVKRCVPRVVKARQYSVEKKVVERTINVGRPVEPMLIGNTWQWEFPAYLFEGRIDKEGARSGVVPFPCTMAAVRLETDAMTGHVRVDSVYNYHTIVGVDDDAEIDQLWQKLNPPDVDLSITFFLDGRSIASVARHGKPL